MSIVINETNIDGILLVKPHIYSDARGEYIKYYESDEMKRAGIECVFTENSDLHSKKGALRGLHYQSKNSQAKLVHVIKGKVFDVALDMRKDSKTFGQYYCCVLDDVERYGVFIPEGFAHGYISLTDQSIFSYLSSSQYLPDFCGGIIWNDEYLNIPWPLKEYGIEEVIATEKDMKWPSFREFVAGIK